MKKNLFGLFITLLVIASGCKKTEETPLIVPQGKFSGKFTRLHLDKRTNKIDTLKADMVITLSTTTGYAVLSDTTVVHAGSKGLYGVDRSFIEFSDNTIPAGPLSIIGKTHLAGVYQYNYNGNNLQIGRSNDTLSYYYNLLLTQ